MIYKSPSNIALIKYIGKKDANHPINPSLSYTLNHFISGVRIFKSSHRRDEHSQEKMQDYWQPLTGLRWLPISMTEDEKKRFLVFFKKLKIFFNLNEIYCVQSANNFPKNIGVASSASSFSALTLAVYGQVLKGRKEQFKSLSTENLSQISREGSGSSCRSFFKPWCLWDKNKIQSLSFPFNKLDHDLVLSRNEEKKIASSTAHCLIRTSPYFENRADRAKKRLKKFIHFMLKTDWMNLYKIVKDEFQDMHQLFETSTPSFSYQNDQTKKVLEEVEKFWRDNKDGPLVTMDAGSSIHLLYRPDQKKIRKTLKEMILKNVPDIQFF